MPADIIDTVDLFPVIGDRLVELLSGLGDEDFERPTQFERWRVKDICAHLVDTAVRRLSFQRDGYRPTGGAAPGSYRELVSLVTDLADRWADAFVAVSPRVLVGMLERYQGELHEFLASLDPFAEAPFAVAWAGEERSPNWFDVAREYTERWHHQAQLREALGAEQLYEPGLYRPALETFLRALPYHYRDIERPEGFRFRVEIAGPAGVSRDIVRVRDSWRLDDGIAVGAAHGMTDGTGESSEPDAIARVPEASAWKIFTRWRDRSAYVVAAEGDPALGDRLKEMSCLLIGDAP